MSTPTRRQLEKNFQRILVLSFFQVFLVLMPIIVLFFESRGLTLPEIFLLQAWFAAVVLVMEAPSGYLADLLGRKRVIVAGTFFMGVGQSILLFAEGFWQLALFESCLGLGLSLVSGSDLALLYDTELALHEDAHRKRKAVRRLFTTQNISEALAAVTCSVLLLWSMEAAVYAQVAGGWVAFLLTFGLVEPPVARLARDSHLQNIRTVLRHLLLNGPVLRLTFLALSVWALTTMFAIWLLQKHWQQLGIGIIHFGYLWGVLTFISAVAGRYALSLEDRLGSTAMLLIVGIGPVLGYIGLGALGAVGGVLVSMVFLRLPRLRPRCAERRIEQARVERVSGHRQLIRQPGFPRRLRLDGPPGRRRAKPVGYGDDVPAPGRDEPGDFRNACGAPHRRREPRARLRQPSDGGVERCYWLRRICGSKTVVNRNETRRPTGPGGQDLIAVDTNVAVRMPTTDNPAQATAAAASLQRVVVFPRATDPRRPPPGRTRRTSAPWYRGSSGP